jgi:hypothetical protein
MEDEMDGACRTLEMRKLHPKFWSEKPDRKSIFRTPGHKWLIICKWI